MESVFPAYSRCFASEIRLLLLCAAVVVCLLFPACSPSDNNPPSSNQKIEFISPTRIANSDYGDIYVSDHKKGSVVLLDDEGRWIRSIAGFTAPLGLAVFEAPPVFDCPEFIDETYDRKCDGKTFLFVGDKGDGSVRVLIGRKKVGVLGKGRREFGIPNGIAVTRDMTVYVVDSQANQVKVYDSSGDQQTTFGDPGLNFPTDIALNETAGELYVADFHNRRIRVYDLDGSWLRDIFSPLNDQDDPVFWKPAGIGIDTDGNLYVVDNALSCVAKISPHGDLLQAIGYSGGQYWTGELSVPVDAAAYGTRIFVTSNGQRELRIFEVVP